MIKHMSKGKHKGQYQIRIQPTNKVTGKRESCPVSYAKNKSAAKALERKMWADYEAGFNLADGNAIFADEFSKFVDERKAGLSPVTIKDWNYTARVVKQYFGTAKINQITTTRISNFAHQFVKDRNLKIVKSGVIHHRLTHIRSYFNSIKGKIVRTNPVPEKALTAFFRRSEFDLGEKRYIFSESELKALKKEIISNLSAVDVTRWLTKLAIWIAIETGMRPEEIQALRFNNLVSSNGHITFEINDSWSNYSKKFNGALKCRPRGSSRVCLPISESLVDFIHKFQLKQEKFLKAHALSNPENLIFLNIRNYKSSANNQPINQRSINEMLLKLCDRLNITPEADEKISLYSFRHTICTKLANKKGIAYPWAASKMGNSLSVFMNTYVNVDRDLDEKMTENWLSQDAQEMHTTSLKESRKRC